MSQSSRQPWVIGPFPPPLHGAAAIDAAIAGRLTERGTRHGALDIGPGTARGLAYHASRIARTLRACGAVLAGGRRRILLSVDGGMGIAYNIAIVAAARLAGADLALYHHSTAYLVRESPLARLLLRLAGRQAIQVMCSPAMAATLQQRYGAGAKNLIITNAAWVAPVAPAPWSAHQGLRLGHLSGLCAEKGLDRALALLRGARAAGMEATLALAGTPMNDAAAATIAAAQAEFGDALDYRGKVTGAKKDAFYGGLDYFLFPSLYGNETQSLVVPEALAAGAPVIAIDHRFVGEMVGEDGGLLVAPDADFASVALDWIGAGGTAMRKDAARARFTRLHSAATGQISRLLDWLGGQIL